MLTPLYQYYDLKRVQTDGSRLYQLPSGEKVASVTTILEATKNEEDKLALHRWRQRVGAEKAQQITIEAASRGTRMHKWLENYIKNDATGEPGSNPYSKQSHQMAQIIIEQYLKPNITKYYGSEVRLYYPGLYAGTTDVVVEWQGQLTILDFKQTNKPKSDERVQDYLIQLAAYALAHNSMFDTNINQGVVLMCSQDYKPQFWTICGDVFDQYAQRWAVKVDQYYS